MKQRFNFEEVFINILIKRTDQYQGLFSRMMDDNECSRVVKKILLAKIYARLRKTG